MKSAQTLVNKGFALIWWRSPLFLSPCSYSELLYRLPYQGRNKSSLNPLRTDRKQIEAMNAPRRSNENPRNVGRKGRMKILSHEHLHCREFGSALLDVGYLAEWLKSKRIRSPITLDGDFVQVEWFLAAIQRSVQDSLTDDEAREIVLANEKLRDHRSAHLSPAWLLGGEAYLQWSSLIREAVDRNELVLLDFCSKLPIASNIATPPESENEDQPSFGAGHEWIARAQTMAALIIEKDVASGAKSKKRLAAQEIADVFAADGTRTKNGQKIDADYVERHALRGWSDMISEQEKKKLQAQ